MGEWTQIAQRGGKRDLFVRVDRTNPTVVPDFQVGSVLPFTSAEAKEYGKNRYGHGESPPGVLRTAYGLTKDKRWIRRVVEAQLEVNRVLGLMVALAVQQREHDASGGGPAPAHEPPRCRIGARSRPAPATGPPRPPSLPSQASQLGRIGRRLRSATRQAARRARPSVLLDRPTAHRRRGRSTTHLRSPGPAR